MGNKTNKYKKKENVLFSDSDVTKYMYDDFILIQLHEDKSISLKDIVNFISYLTDVTKDLVILTYLRKNEIEYCLSKDILWVCNKLISEKFDKEIEYFFILQIKCHAPSACIMYELARSATSEKEDKFNLNCFSRKFLRYKRNGCRILILK